LALFAGPIKSMANRSIRSRPGGLAVLVREQKEKASPSLSLAPSTRLESKSGTQSTIVALARRAPSSTKQPLRRRRKGGGGQHRGNAPRLPPEIEAVLAVPFRIRCVSGTTTTAVAPNIITRKSFASMLGGICTTANTSVRLWASSFRITRITAWPAASGDCFIACVISGTTAEQALQKDSQKVGTLPNGITSTTGGHQYRPKPGTYLSMWQVVNNDETDRLLQYASTSGSVWDFEGVFTLPSGTAATSTVTVTTALLGSIYYLYPDGQTTHDLTVQGLTTTI
jgi:hypothetical protein